MSSENNRLLHPITMHCGTKGKWTAKAPMRDSSTIAPSKMTRHSAARLQRRKARNAKGRQRRGSK